MDFGTLYQASAGSLEFMGFVVFLEFIEFVEFLC
jgi:hypothetical protein